jgi:hypothetical protein
MFVCPLNFNEMTGVVPFVYLSTCSCVFSQAGLKAVSSLTRSIVASTNVAGTVMETESGTGSTVSASGTLNENETDATVSGTEIRIATARRCSRRSEG